MNKLTMYVLEIMNETDGNTSFFETKEEALKEAQTSWDALADYDKARYTITVGKCDTCAVNEDGVIDYAEQDGFALCDLSEVYAEYSI